MPDTPLPTATATLAQLEDHGAFERRHIGPDEAEQRARRWGSPRAPR